MANNQEQVAQQAEDQPQKIVIKSKRWLPLESDPELVSSPQLTVMRLPASPKWMSHPTRTNNSTFAVDRTILLFRV